MWQRNDEAITPISLRQLSLSTASLHMFDGLLCAFGTLPTEEVRRGASSKTQLFTCMQSALIRVVEADNAEHLPIGCKVACSTSRGWAVTTNMRFLHRFACCHMAGSKLACGTTMNAAVSEFLRSQWPSIHGVVASW